MQRHLCQITSLLTMLRLYGPQFVAIGHTLREIRDGYLQSEIISGADLDRLKINLNSLLSACRSMKLDVSADVLESYIKEMTDDQELTHSRAALRIGHWESTFFAELSREVFFQLPARDAVYFCDGVSSGEEINASVHALGAFKDAAFDIKEAGCCMALDRPTAAVYHLMRAAEYGLVAVATSIGVPPEKRTSWETMIGGIHGEVKTKVSRKVVNCKEDERKYDDICAWFTTIKNGWRNPVSHVPIRYSQNTAKGMLSAVRTLFEHLTQHQITPCAMPPETISLPDVL